MAIICVTENKTVNKVCAKRGDWCEYLFFGAL
jgi:hypothetical protein